VEGRPLSSLEVRFLAGLTEVAKSRLKGPSRSWRGLWPSARSVAHSFEAILGSLYPGIVIGCLLSK
jgi:hypothetical protein